MSIDFRETFIVRTEWADTILQMDDLDQLAIFHNLFHFHMGNDHLIILNNLPIKLVWGLILPNLCRNIENYDKRRDTSVENGKKGGRPKGSNKNQNKPILSYNETNYPNESLSVSDSVIVSDIVSDSDPVVLDPPPRYEYVPPHQQAKKEGTGPALDDVQLFFMQNGISDDTYERFYNRYEATGWMINTNSITNWRAVARTWIMDPNKFATQGIVSGDKSKLQNNISANQTAKEINRKIHESGSNNSK